MNAGSLRVNVENVARAVIYCRVSTTKQTIRGHGLESQEMRCREHAAARGYEVAAVFPDDASGGGDFMTRPGMVALLSFLRAQPDTPHIVIFDDLKRFARDAEFHIKLRRELNAVGAKVECLNFRLGLSGRGVHRDDHGCAGRTRAQAEPASGHSEDEGARSCGLLPLRAGLRLHLRQGRWARQNARPRRLPSEDRSRLL